MMTLLHKRPHWRIFLFCVIYSGYATAEMQYTPADIFASTQYARQLVEALLTHRGVVVPNTLPRSQETAVKPMHVYELYIAALMEVYNHELNRQRHPPPLVAAAPINYTPMETYQLAQIVVAALEELYQDEIGPLTITRPPSPANKTPAEVYQALFELYIRLVQLNGKPFPTPDDVYAQLHRAVDDLKSVVITLSQQLPDEQERNKRLFITAAYGFNTDGTYLSPLETNKKPADVLAKMLRVRDQLNTLRQHYRLPIIQHPEASAFKTVSPADVFLQTQIIIAELNIIKMTQKISTITNLAQSVTGKTPADTYQEIKRIEYMLERIITVLR